MFIIIALKTEYKKYLNARDETDLIFKTVLGSEYTKYHQ